MLVGVGLLAKPGNANIFDEAVAIAVEEDAGPALMSVDIEAMLLDELAGVARPPAPWWR